jgi:hypothetical protein
MFRVCDINGGIIIKAAMVNDVRPSGLLLNTNICDEPEDSYSSFLRIIFTRLLHYVVQSGNTTICAFHGKFHPITGHECPEGSRV